jgi:hypothetical protein
MKKNQFCFMAMAIIISLSACTKDENDEKEISLETKDAPVLISKYTSTSDSENQNSTFATQNFYDDENKLILTYQSFISFYNGEISQDDKDTISYNYDNEGRLIELAQTGDNYPHKVEFTYTDNEMRSVESYYSGAEYVLSIKNESTLDFEGKVIRVQEYYFDSFTQAWNKASGFRIHEWADKNVVKSVTYESSNRKSASILNPNIILSQHHGLSDSVIRYERVYSFNDKINPEVFSSIKAKNYIPTSKNLITSYSGSDMDGIYSSKGNITYEYGANGFPARVTEIFEMTINIPGRDPSVSTSTTITQYEYIDLK